MNYWRKCFDCNAIGMYEDGDHPNFIQCRTCGSKDTRLHFFHPGNSVNEHATEFDEAEHRLRQDIEEALEMATECLSDSTLWWQREEKGPRTVDTLIGMIVVAAKRYSQRCLGVGLTDELKILVGRCEVGESSFSNDDMSDALFICQSLLSRVDELEDNLRQVTSGRIPQIGEDE